jgi:hypothetical protein
MQAIEKQTCPTEHRDRLQDNRHRSNLYKKVHTPRALQCKRVTRRYTVPCLLHLLGEIRYFKLTVFILLVTWNGRRSGIESSHSGNFNRKIVSICEDGLVPNHHAMQTWRYKRQVSVLQMNHELYPSVALLPGKRNR